MTDAPRTDGPVPATGTLGVGRGDGVAVGANATVVGVGVRVGVAVVPGTCVGDGVLVGPGVFVGVDVGVFVGVDVGVPVGVPVALAIVNVSVQAGATAAGVSCGTVGATGPSWRRRWVVKKIITPRPPVTRVSKRRCQCFFSHFISAPRSVNEYFSFNGKCCCGCGNGKVHRVLVACIFCRGHGERASVHADSSLGCTVSFHRQHNLIPRTES